MLVADGELTADCYMAAAEKDQAKIPFKDSVNFLNRNQRLDSVIKRSGSDGQEWNLAYLKTGSFLRRSRQNPKAAAAPDSAPTSCCWTNCTSIQPPPWSTSPKPT
jgi:hypothetical protein